MAVLTLVMSYIGVLLTVVDTLEIPSEIGAVSNEDVLEQIVGVSAHRCQKECRKHGATCSGIFL